MSNCSYFLIYCIFKNENGLGDVKIKLYVLVLRTVFPLDACYCLNQLERKENVLCDIVVQWVLLFSFVCIRESFIFKVFSRMFFLEDLVSVRSRRSFLDFLLSRE